MERGGKMPYAAVIDRDFRRCRRLAASVQACLRRQAEGWRVDALPSCQRAAFFYDMVILSVDNGLDEARRLRERDRRMALLLVADTEAYVIRGYDLRAAAYLLRPVEAEPLEEGLASALSRLNQNRAYIDLPAEGGTRREILNNILYIEEEGPNSRVCTFEREYRLLAPPDVLGLPRHFFPCDGRRVNLAHVDQVGNESLWMEGIRLPISWKTRQRLINSLPVVIEASADPF